MRGCVVWNRRTGDSSYELATAWFSDLSSDTPAVHSQTTLFATSSTARFATLVPGPAGMRLLARGSGDLLTLYGHDLGAPLTSWPLRAKGPYVSSRSAPVGVALANGDVLATVERDVDASLVSVLRFAPGASSAVTELELSGYMQPTLTADPQGSGALLAAVRRSDRHLVSRQRSPLGWTSSDRIEVGAEGRGQLAWPNAVRQTDGRLRLVMEGAGASTSTSSVLFFQRPL